MTISCAPLWSSLTLGAALLLAQCSSKPPEKPLFVSPAIYSAYNCSQLGQEEQALSAKSAELSQEQKNNWLGPFGSGADAGPRLTQIKGQMTAIQLASKAKNCELKPVN